MDRYEIGVLGIQVGITCDKRDNLKRAAKLIDEGFEKYKKIDLVCLPEQFYSSASPHTRDKAGETYDSDFFYTFSELASKHNVNIITGSFPLSRDGKLYDCDLCINRSGEIIGEYCKAHLFDAFVSKESDTFDAGNALGIIDFDFGRVGLVHSFELRFTEYLRTLALKGIDLLVVPSMFFQPRVDHWNTLVASAALNNLIYVVAPNQFNSQHFGRSCIVDPFGVTIAQASDMECSFYGTIDLNFQRQVRSRVPLYKNRRPELYDVN
ncbi:MAG: nitrilase-related carbon-nitrogen hydrolase [Eubacteriales bacterium]|nr:nitrilase-related carbon-nitrogen hydrolase [Eubacteriales bacterium]